MSNTQTSRTVHAALATQLQVGDFYLRWTGEWYRIVEIDHQTRGAFGGVPVLGVDRRGGRIHDTLDHTRTHRCWITPEHRVGTTLAS